MNRILDECDSTNDLARKLGEEGCPDGTWVSARRQNRGRGRSGRQWQSLDGNLFLSLVLNEVPMSLWTWVPLTAAVSTAGMLRQMSPGLDVRIKWPNDLFLNDAKLGGVLCEGVGTSSRSFIVVGLGLNCTSAPESIDQPAASLGGLTADEVRLPIVTAIREGVDELRRNGPGEISRLYSEWAQYRPGTMIQWRGHSGEVVGLGPSGELMVKTLDGAITRLFAEDIQKG